MKLARVAEACGMVVVALVLLYAAGGRRYLDIFVAERIGVADTYREMGMIPHGASHVFARRDFSLNGDGYEFLTYSIDPATIPKNEEGWKSPVSPEARAKLEEVLNHHGIWKWRWPDLASPTLEFKGDPSSAGPFGVWIRDRATGQVWFGALNM